MAHPVTWHTAAPLWTEALRDPGRGAFRRPELLRFTTDTFMEDLAVLLADDPARLGSAVARAERWDKAYPNPEAPATEAVKLFQPAHGRFYLVSAALVCQTRGLPDRAVDGGKSEAAAFIVRRLIVPASGGAAVEHGWFGEGTGWKPVNGPDGLDWQPEPSGDGQAALVREERLPLFPLSYAQGKTGRKRRLLAGLVPVSNRERYEASPRAAADVLDPDDLAGDPLADVRLAALDTWAEGLRLLAEADAKKANSSAWDAEAHDVFAFALLDLVDFLREHLPALWDAIENGTRPAGTAGDAYDALAVAVDPGDRTWISALQRVAAHEADVRLGEPPDLGESGNALTASEIADGINDLLASDFVDDLETLIEATPPPPLDALGDAFPGAPAITDGGPEAVYTVRCVYERPNGAFCRPVVSDPSRPFRLAGFFDPEAPARPTRIALPVDTSPAGLRQFPKNVSFLVSNELRRQMDNIPSSFGDLDDGNVGSGGGLTLGMICSLSIPIITICALILLMIIVQLLNIVFWWLPFFKICLPIPVAKD